MERTPQNRCITNELVLFIISKYLSGEYVLRTFPLLCKSTRSFRFSLSLLGLGSRHLRCENPKTMIVDGEGEIYGIYSTWRHLHRVMMLNHSINSLKVLREEEMLMTSTLPDLEKLYIPKASISISAVKWKTFFPKLTKIEIEEAHMQDLLMGLWQLPLISLIVNKTQENSDYDNDGDGNGDNQLHKCEHGPPVFAQTLRVLHIYGSTDKVMNLLSPYCQNLQDIGGHDYHKIMANNPNVTALSLFATNPNLSQIDLSQHTQLVKLVIARDRRFFSQETLSSLEHVSFTDAHIKSIKMFLMPQRCPTMHHVTLRMNWKKMAQVIADLDPNKCKLLTLELSKFSTYPSLNEVKKAILDRGFRLNNEQFLLGTRHATHNWEMIKKAVPGMKDWKHLQGDWLGQGSKLERLVGIPCYFFTSCPSLAAIHLVTSRKLLWTKRILQSVIDSCSQLKRLYITGTFKGALQIESLSLTHLKMEWTTGFSARGMNLKLPNLVHLSLRLCWDEEIMFQRQLNQISQLLQPQMPRLRYLQIIPDTKDDDTHEDSDYSESTESDEEHNESNKNENKNSSESTESDQEQKESKKNESDDEDSGTRNSSQHSTSFSLAHPSLSHLIIKGNCGFNIKKITLQDLRNLQEVTIDGLTCIIQVILEIPGGCDLYLRYCGAYDESSTYIRSGDSSQSMFKATLCLTKGKSATTERHWEEKREEQSRSEESKEDTERRVEDRTSKKRRVIES